jgi:hypothetical protein
MCDVIGYKVANKCTKGKENKREDGLERVQREDN